MKYAYVLDSAMWISVNYDRNVWIINEQFNHGSQLVYRNRFHIHISGPGGLNSVGVFFYLVCKLFNKYHTLKTMNV